MRSSRFLFLSIHLWPLAKLKSFFSRLLPSLSLLLFSVVGMAQNLQLSGYVRDQNTGESLSSAVLRVPELGLSVSSNSYGFYSISLPSGKHRLLWSFQGYAPLSDSVNLLGDSTLNFFLSAASQRIEEVVVRSNNSAQDVSSAQMGTLNFQMRELKNVPMIFGEQDLLKTIQLMPGVASGGEGSSSFYVRGGSGDQNLILLDEAVVYNAAHLLGFFSTFNADAVKEATLYKGGVPAQYGGRASSVLDIHMLEGNNQRFSAEGGLGLIASRLKLEGPVGRQDRGSFMISGRRTYADLFLKLSKDQTVNSSQLYFYDLNAKMNLKLNDKNRLYLSGYFGKDDLGYSDLFGFDWGNATGTLRWNSVLNSRLFSNTSLIYSDFTYNVDVDSDNSNFAIASKIRNWHLKQDFSFYPSSKHTLKFGLSALHQQVMPASIAADESSQINSIAIQKRRGLELALYVSDDWQVSDRLKLLYGLRLSDFMVLGPGTFYTFDEQGEPSSAQDYSSSGVIKHYTVLEPRISLAYLLSENRSIKASFNRMSQNLHQLSNSTASLPTDQYMLSSLNIRPQIADQVALGYFQNFASARYEFSIESYYKRMKNQIDFRNGADLQANEQIEGDLLFGQGRAYGLEFLLKKNKGKFRGWVGYTLARSERQFDEINQGNWFLARQDRRHDITLVGMYSLSDKWELGANFTYNTGQAITFPSGKYQVDGETMFYYTERNGYRMPDYHRLDLSATYTPRNSRPDKRFQSSWSFGLYNAYNRKNAYLIDFREKEDQPGQTEAYQIALFGIIPSVTWNFSF